MEWLSKIPMPDSDNGQLCKEGDGLSDSGNDGNDEDSLQNGANDDARARRKSFASFASKTLSLRSARNGSMDVSVFEQCQIVYGNSLIKYYSSTVSRLELYITRRAQYQLVAIR